MNKVLLTGRLTKDPKFNSYNEQNEGFTNFVLAVTRPNTRNEISDFFSCIAWKEKANFVYKYIKKGDLVAITGVLQTRQYDDSKTHEKRVMTEIYVEQIEICASKFKNTQQDQNQDEGFGQQYEYEPNW